MVIVAAREPRNYSPVLIRSTAILVAVIAAFLATKPRNKTSQQKYDKDTNR
jgi:hypothetical protein